MKRILTLLTLLLACNISSFAQAPHWDWAIGSRECGSTLAYFEGGAFASCTDSKGNVYFTASERNGNCVGFGPDSLVYSTYGSLDHNFFVVKYDSAGNFRWLRDAGANSLAIPASITADDSDNIYVSGSISGDVIFGTDTLHSITGNLFIVKYDSNGNVRWATGSSGNIGNPVITFDHNNGILLSASLGTYTTTLDSITLPMASPSDVLIAKYNRNGRILWAKRSVTAPAGVLPQAITSDRWGNAYISGFFNAATLIFGYDTLTNAHTSRQNIYLAKYGTGGNAIWAKEIKIQDSLNGAGMNVITTDRAGNVYMAGNFMADSMVIGTTHIFNHRPWTSDIYLTRFDSAGHVIWAKGEGDTSADFASGITVDQHGLVWICGGFGSPSLSIDGIALTTPHSGSAGITDAGYLAAFDSSGMMHYATPVNYGGDDWLSLCSDPASNIYVAGDYYTFGGSSTLEIGTHYLPSFAGPENGFIAKLLNEVNYPTTRVSDPENKIMIYPNPAKDRLHIVLGTCTGSNAIYFYDLTGQLVKTAPVSSTNTDIPISDLNPGFYICRIMIDGATCIKKVMIE